MNYTSKANHERKASNPDTSAPEILERLVTQAEQAGASDIHLQMRGQIAEVSFRLDGVISAASELPKDIAERVCGRIKFLARLKTYQDSLPQDGRIDLSILDQRDPAPSSRPSLESNSAKRHLVGHVIRYARSGRRLAVGTRTYTTLQKNCPGATAIHFFGRSRKQVRKMKIIASNSRKRQSGVAVIVVLAFLAIILLFLSVNFHSINHLSLELKLIEQLQVQRLHDRVVTRTSATNTQ